MAKCYHWYKGKSKEKTNFIVTRGIDKRIQISKIGQYPSSGYYLHFRKQDSFVLLSVI